MILKIAICDDCEKDDCAILKYGLGEEDIKQAYEELYEIASHMNK